MTGLMEALGGLGSLGDSDGLVCQAGVGSVTVTVFALCSDPFLRFPYVSLRTGFALYSLSTFSRVRVVMERANVLPSSEREVTWFLSHFTFHPETDKGPT